jgi:protein-disulfide isomerase
VPPPIKGKSRSNARKASPRVLIAVAAVTVVVVLAVVLAVTLGRGSSNPVANAPAVGSLAQALPGAADVNALLAGIPQHDTTLGKASAPVTMTEFVDPQCPYCQEFETSVLPDLVRTDVRAGKLRIVLEPWAFIGPDSIRGQAAVLAAARQNKAFNYLAVLYDNQGEENTGWLDDTMIATIAASIPGLHVHSLLLSRDSDAVKTAQQHVDRLATTDRVTGTPTIYVGKTGAKGSIVSLSSPTDEESVTAAIADSA